MTNQTEQALYGKQVQLFVTDLCDLSCSGCPYPKIRREKRAELLSQQISPDKWRPITDYLYEQGSREFCIIGGEPGSYKGVDQLITGITHHSDALVLFSTSGIHLLKDELRTRVGTALASDSNRRIRNGYIISFDALPKGRTSGSREAKAQAGLKSVKLLQQEFGDKITYAANVMLHPGNLDEVLKIQEFLEREGVYTNLCTQQTACFGEKSVFDESHKNQLIEISLEMIRRKIQGGMVVNSVAYLSQLAYRAVKQSYHCWEEPNGSPILDIGPNGAVRFCNWIGNNDPEGPPGINIRRMMSGEISWPEFCGQSKQTTQERCSGCSWSRRDRSEDMFSPNQQILGRREFQQVNPYAPESQNIWAQAQSLCRQ